MRNSFAIRLTATILASSVTLLAQQDRISETLDSGKVVVVHGSRHPRAVALYDRGPAELSLEIPFVTLALKPSAEQQTELDRLLAEQQDPSSSNYHKWLTPEQYGDRFGLSRTDIGKISAWLRAEGFTLNDAARGRHWITFSGTAERVNHTFGARMHRYDVDGRMRFANAAEPSVPAALAGVVSGIRGLDDFPAEPLYMMDRAVGEGGVPEYNVNGLHLLVPDDLATIYNIGPLYSAGIDGTGQKIVITGQADLNLADVAAFRKRFNLPANVPQTILVGPDPGVSTSSAEALLDVEWSGAVARNATILFVYARSAQTAAQYAVDQNLAPVLSMSFGMCEPEVSNPGFRSIAQQANAQGITWLTSSDDAGGAGCDRQGMRPQATRGAAVNYLASMPEVTGVGGSMFDEGGGNYWGAANGANGGSALSYIPEVVWNESGAGGIGASGGGASILFSKPLWQIGPGVPDDNARDVPDLSLASAGHDGYFIIEGGAIHSVGGTSAAAPSFAGMVALLNHYLTSNGSLAQAGLGNINPNLYRLAQSTANVFHDISAGDNRVPCAQSSPDCATGSIGFSAGPGYDLATGLGSVDAYNLISQWNSHRAETTTTLAANPGVAPWGSSLELTASVSGSDAAAAPTGMVSFHMGGTLLGSATLSGLGGTATAVLTINANQLPVGVRTLSVLYGGDARFEGSAGSAAVTITAPGGSSAVRLSIAPNPVYEAQPDSNGFAWSATIRLTETAGVSTTITEFTLDGATETLSSFFQSPNIAANGVAVAGISFRNLRAPVTRMFKFTGVDANGQTWSQQQPVTFLGPVVRATMRLTSTTGTVTQNPAADPDCQWSRQLNLQETDGFSIQLTKFLAGAGNDMSGQIQQLFGTTKLGPFGSLQATVCTAGDGPPEAKTYEIDGTDDSGRTITATFSSTFAGPAETPGTLSASPGQVTMAVADSTLTDSASVEVTPTGGATQWSVSVFPSNVTTSWLKVSPLSGSGSGQLSLQASGAGLTKGVYRATLLIQSVNATPQYLNVPVVFVVGISSTTAITGVSNGASFTQAFAPGALMTVFGSELSFSEQKANRLPLPISMAGVSATVNGVAAPLYYVSPGQIDIQIPYETGSGVAVLGVNNSGQVASYKFQVAASAPGIFTDPNGALAPSGSGRPGQTLLLFITGEGDVAPSLLDGATPAASTAVAGLPKPRLPVTVTIGGEPAQILFAGIPNGVAGVTQVNFTIPEDAATGTNPVVVTVGGVTSPPANLTVMP